jgi:glucosamine-6-phosphate deaminase
MMSTPATVSVQVVDRDHFGPAAADAVLSDLPGELGRLGVASGSTPLLLYRELARRAQFGRIDLHTAVLVALDEYVGLGADDPRSYHTYVRDKIAVPLNVDAPDVMVPNGLSADPDAEAAAFEQAIVDLGGMDVQIAGLGTNGHLGFNEPGSPFDAACRTVMLTERTRRDNARFFDGRAEDVPKGAITQGLGTICRARSIVLLAMGSHKADALAAALLGPVSTDVPASILQRHPHVTVIADHDAAARL